MLLQALAGYPEKSCWRLAERRYFDVLDQGWESELQLRDVDTAQAVEQDLVLAVFHCAIGALKTAGGGNRREAWLDTSE
jgi:hypothetical protein